jgi:uncharacterized membrane protein YidH (DUF202 family)
MNTVKLLGILLIIAGGLAAAYGGFSYTKQTHAATIGPIHLQMTEQERVNIPLWMGLGALGVGVLLVATSRKN